MCFGCSNEPSHRDGSFEYPQHKFWRRNKENNFPIRTLIWRPVLPAGLESHVVRELAFFNFLKIPNFGNTINLEIGSKTYEILTVTCLK